MMMESDQIINYSALDNEHTGVVKKIIWEKECIIDGRIDCHICNFGVALWSV